MSDLHYEAWRSALSPIGLMRDRIEELEIEFSSIEKERDELRKPFARADEHDWRRLDQILGYSAHGRFWREVFKEFRSVLSPKDAGGESC